MKTHLTITVSQLAAGFLVSMGSSRLSSTGTEILTVLLLEAEPSVDFSVQILLCFCIIS